MLAARLYAPNDMRLEDIAISKPGPGQAVCKVIRCGMCGTDHSIYTASASFMDMIRYPMTFGHEWSGVVTDIADDVVDLKLGDRVTGDTSVSCGKCKDCFHGNYNYCKHGQAVGTVNAWDGAYAEYILFEARHLYKLPDNVSFDNGAMVEPAATGLYSVVRSGLKLGETILIHGTGPIGIMAAKQAKLMGASKVIITGRKEYKLDMAKSFGADYTINTTEVSMSDAVKDITKGEGVNRIVDAAGSVDLFRESLKLTKLGGVISLVAFYEGQLLANLNLDDIVFRDLTIVGVPGSFGMYPIVLNLMEAGMLDLTPLISAKYKLTDVNQGMADMSSRNDKRIKFMIDVAE
ncbi:MAG: zinc-dependent alcohol dehydrogenase [Armatimonadota bacterium]